MIIQEGIRENGFSDALLNGYKMSVKRILGITAFGILFIAAVIGAVLLASYLRQDNDAIPLPDTSLPAESSNGTDPDAPGRVEVTTETIQAIVSELSRPDTYSRDTTIEVLWDGGNALYNISVNVTDGMTSLRITPPAGGEKRVIITRDKLYIWYTGDSTLYESSAGSAGDGYRAADEWQMLVTYEDVLQLDKKDIIDAGYTEWGGEYCLYAEYLSPLLGYMRKYYISIELGLVTGAEEYDKTGALVYTMTAGECTLGEADTAAFTLPDGTVLIQQEITE